MKKIFILISFISLFLSLALINAQMQTGLGSVKQGSCITLPQVINATSCIVKSIQYPDLDVEVIDGTMTADGIYWNYSNWCKTQTIGTYIVTTVCDGIGYPYDFEVTPSGFTGTLGFTIVILLVCSAIIVLGFWIKDGWFVVFGGMALIGFGIYSVINGIAGFKDGLLTWGTSLFLIGIGAYLSINAAIEMTNE